jgi:hypothetical protein
MKKEKKEVLIVTRDELIGEIYTTFPKGKQKILYFKIKGRNRGDNGTSQIETRYKD